jgi:hypothetical protein
MKSVLTAMASLSLLLSFASLGLWKESYDAPEAWEWTHAKTTWDVTTYTGSVRLMRIAGTQVVSGLSHVRPQQWTASGPTDFGRVPPMMFVSLPRARLGLQIASGTWGLNACAPPYSSPTARWQMFLLPDWLISGSLALPAVSLGVAAARKRSRDWKNYREKRCGACGYDLRASTERCPECGTPIQAMQ